MLDDALREIIGEELRRVLREELAARGEQGRPAASADELVEIVRRAIAGNPKAVADFKKGKTTVLMVFVGAVMKETKGTANAEAVKQLVQEELAKA